MFYRVFYYFPQKELYAQRYARRVICCCCRRCYFLVVWTDIYKKIPTYVVLLNYCIHAFFINSTFISNARLKLVKSQANTKQYFETELLLFENYSHCSFTFFYHQKITRYILKNKQKYKCVDIHEIIWLIIIKG